MHENTVENSVILCRSCDLAIRKRALPQVLEPYVRVAALHSMIRHIAQ